MCLGIPMKIEKIQGEFAQVQSGSLKRQVNIQMLSSIKLGDYVIVHAGFAIEKLNSQKAKETLKIIHEIR
ncbi:MAG: HypC/HybG/HupF family hydrogenase formation chaperone [Candidatus Omnitrophica bacterium]|nr:HypC/HybG/HupF family hydrogenase formation chaperone [Candidatus Omnitrophota bacterium]